MVGLVVIIFIIFFIMLGMVLSVISIDKKKNDNLLENGVELWANVKQSDLTREYDENHFVTSIHYSVTYEFEYRTHIEKTLTYNIYEHPQKFNEGDKILCIYDAENDVLYDKEELIKANTSVYKTPLIIFAIFSFLIIGIAVPFIYVTNIISSNSPVPAIFSKIEVVALAIMLFIGVILVIALLIALLKKISHNNDIGHVLVKGKVIDIFHKIDWDTETKKEHHLYKPIIEFSYGGKTITFISGLLPSSSKNSLRYHIGDEIDIKYNPETNYYSEKNDTKKVIIIIAVVTIIFIIFLALEIPNIFFNSNFKHIINS